MIRALLVDDEQHALDLLEMRLLETKKVLVAGKYRSVLEAMDELVGQRADALFLDIEMPGLKGNDAARMIKAKHPGIHIVFTSAHAEYALEAFEIKALDYVLKPFHPARIQATVERLAEAVHPNESKGAAGTEIYCMNDFIVRHDGTELSWRTNKEKELLAFLVHGGEQAVDQDVIMEALWPETMPEKARSYLYTCMWQLRKNLRTNNLPILVNKNGKRYSLSAGNTVCDAVLLDALLNRILKERALDEKQYEQLVDLYKGDYLDVCDYPWAYGKKAQLSSKYMEALKLLYDFFKQNRQSAYALDCLKQIAAVSPESEQEGRELMKLLADAGNRKEALQVYRQLKEAVQDRMNVSLEDATVALYNRLFSDYDKRGV